MTPRQLVILMSLFGAGMVAASVARSGSPGPVAESRPEPVKATIVELSAADTPKQPQQPIRVILPSPFEVR